MFLEMRFQTFLEPVTKPRPARRVAVGWASRPTRTARSEGVVGRTGEHLATTLE